MTIFFSPCFQRQALNRPWSNVGDNRPIEITPTEGICVCVVSTRWRTVARRGVHVDRHLNFVLPAAEQHAADRAHVLEVSTEGYGDMLLFGDEIVRGIEVDPTPFGRPDRDPGMGRIRADKLRLALGRVGKQIAADIARSEAERAKACDFEVCEILADASPDLQHLLDRRRRVGCSGLVLEFAVNCCSDVLHRFEEGAALRKAWSREFVDVARRPDVSRRAGIPNGFKSLGAEVGAKLRRDVVPARRPVRLNGLWRLNVNLRPGMNFQLRMVLLDGDDRSWISEIVHELRFRGGRRIDDQAVAQDGLAHVRPGRQMQQVVGLRNRRGVSIDCPVADLEIHRPRPNRV